MLFAGSVARRGSAPRRSGHAGSRAPTRPVPRRARPPRQAALRIIGAVAHRGIDIAALPIPCSTASAASLASIATVRSATIPATSSMRLTSMPACCSVPTTSCAAPLPHWSAIATAMRGVAAKSAARSNNTRSAMASSCARRVALLAVRERQPGLAHLDEAGTPAGPALHLDPCGLEAADEAGRHAKPTDHGDLRRARPWRLACRLRSARRVAIVVEAAAALAAQSARLHQLLLDQAGVKRLSPKQASNTEQVTA